MIFYYSCKYYQTPTSQYLLLAAASIIFLNRLTIILPLFLILRAVKKSVLILVATVTILSKTWSICLREAVLYLMVICYPWNQSASISTNTNALLPLVLVLLVWWFVFLVKLETVPLLFLIFRAVKKCVLALAATVIILFKTWLIC